mgnify:FL=1
MSRNGSGGYSLPVNTWNPATTGVSATVTDWQALINDLATAMQQSVSADGQTPITGNLAMGNNKLTGLSAGTATGHSLRWEQLFSQGTIANLASATTTDIGAQNTSFLNITGTTTITGLGTNYNGPRYLVFAGALTLTHSATLVCPGAANITTAANDSAIAIPISGGWQIVAYQKASGFPISTTGLAPIASPTFTGVPAGPTAAAATSTTQLATTAFVQQEVPAASTTAAGKVELATSAEAQAGTDTTRAITATAMKAAQIQLQTAVTLTTQTEVGFTGIPSWAKRITVNFAGVSTNGSVAPKIQLGDSGGYETTGYLGSMSGGGNGSTLAAANATDSILLHVSPGAGAIMHGSVVLSLISASTNTWAASGVVGRSDLTNAFFVGASKSLDSTLDRLRIYINGTDQFDAGTVNISFE